MKCFLDVLFLIQSILLPIYCILEHIIYPYRYHIYLTAVYLKISYTFIESNWRPAYCLSWLHQGKVYFPCRSRQLSRHLKINKSFRWLNVSADIQDTFYVALFYLRTQITISGRQLPNNSYKHFIVCHTYLSRCVTHTHTHTRQQCFNSASVKLTIFKYTHTYTRGGVFGHSKVY